MRIRTHTYIYTETCKFVRSLNVFARRFALLAFAKYKRSVYNVENASALLVYGALFVVDKSRTSTPARWVGIRGEGD